MQKQNAAELPALFFSLFFFAKFPPSVISLHPPITGEELLNLSNGACSLHWHQGGVVITPRQQQ